MSIVVWIVLGLIAGFFGSKAVGDEGDGLLRHIALGVGGAVFGGWIIVTFGSASVAEFNVWSALAAIIGAVSALALYRAIRRRS